MSKQEPKSNEKLSTIEELALMRRSIRAMRDDINANLDGVLDRINRLIPAEDSNRSKKYKNYSRDDWGKFLGF